MFTAVAVAGGIWGGLAAGSGTQPGTTPGADAAAATSPVAAPLATFRRAVVHAAYDADADRLGRLADVVERFDAGVAELDEARPEGSPARDEGDVEALAEIQEHMDEYLELGAEGDHAGMQIVVWRFLWVDNGLPDSLIATRRAG